MTPTNFPSTRPNASASGRLEGGSATRSSVGTLRSTVGHPQEHLPVTRALSSCGRNARASGGAHSRRRRSATARSAADKGRSSSTVLAGLSRRKRSRILKCSSNVHCALSAIVLLRIPHHGRVVANAEVSSAGPAPAQRAPAGVPGERAAKFRIRSHSPGMSALGAKPVHQGCFRLDLMDLSDVARELKLLYPDGVHYRDLDRHLTEGDVERWSTGCDWSRFQLFEAIARYLALGFNASELSFEFCDAVVNDLSVAVTNTSGPRPQLFWEVYSAFDQGEFYHDNNRNEDPVEVYTRPMIARIAESIRTPARTSHPA
jgi:hypothetical protein